MSSWAGWPLHPGKASLRLHLTFHPCSHCGLRRFQRTVRRWGLLSAAIWRSCFNSRGLRAAG
eukprot:1159668-Pelagomonas_calceolata.AAC.13